MWLVQRAVVAVLVALEILFPSAGALAKAAKQARLLNYRVLYALANNARCGVLQARKVMGRQAPAFDASEVEPGLWLGSLEDAHNLDALLARNITAVITVTPGIAVS